eukprot:SAG22_NODE_1238_length_5049_cov_42.930707_4_plen_357_part_00
MGWVEVSVVEGVATARLMCLGLALSAVAYFAAQSPDPAVCYKDACTQAAAVALALGELTGWYIPLRLVGLSDFRSTVLYSLLFDSPILEKPMWRLAYFVMSFLYPNEEWTCMNYGYQYLAGGAAYAEEEDKLERYSLQLYRKLALSLPGGLAGQRLLEVGSGRGGGLAHLARTQAAAGAPMAAAVGGDLCAQQVALCRTRFGADGPDGAAGLRYVEADAENLPFEDGEFDAVINVESSHCYPDVAKFLRECERVLAAGGHLGIVDFRKVEGRLPLFEAALHAVDGLTVVHEEDITPNVIAACEQDHRRRTDMIEGTVHGPLQKVSSTALSFCCAATVVSDFKRWCLSVRFRCHRPS